MGWLFDFECWGNWVCCLIEGFLIFFELIEDKSDF